MSGLTEGAHQFAITTIFPRIGRIRSTDDVLTTPKELKMRNSGWNRSDLQLLRLESRILSSFGVLRRLRLRRRASGSLRMTVKG